MPYWLVLVLICSGCLGPKQGTYTLYLLSNGTVLTPVSPRTHQPVKPSGCAGLFFTGSMDETVKVWDTNEACLVSSFQFGSKVPSANPNAIPEVCDLRCSAWRSHGTLEPRIA